MDWKRLIQFALSGSGDLEQYAILLVRVSIGLFFAISGQTNYLHPAAPDDVVYTAGRHLQRKSLIARDGEERAVVGGLEAEGLAAPHAALRAGDGLQFSAGGVGVLDLV